MTRYVLILASVALAACAGVGPPPRHTVANVEATLPTVWYAPPLPHQGQTVELTQWWARLGDPALVALIAEAQQGSASIAAARAQVFAARANLAGVDSATGPQVAAVAGAYRGVSAQAPLGTGMNAGLQVSWALDVWGQNASVRQAVALSDAAHAGWHEARVLIAAETARLYLGWRACQAQRDVIGRDRDSRQATERSAELTEKAGLLAPATAALARASRADAENRLAQQTRLCEQQFKALVALTGAQEPAMRERLGGAAGLPDAALLNNTLAVNGVPVEVIRQRPDVARSQRELVAAAEGVGVARAALWPSLSLTGSVLRNRFSADGSNTTFNTWSLGPLSLSLPLIGRSGLTANAQAAQARYEAAAVAYANTLRQAIAEVEQALVALSGLQRQQAASQEAVAGFNRSFQATEARYRVGLANLNELEEARRLQLNADSGAVALRQEHLNTWIALYVALGGGFDPLVSPESARNPS